jgi:hypothetical protein
MFLLVFKLDENTTKSITDLSKLGAIDKFYMRNIVLFESEIVNLSRMHTEKETSTLLKKRHFRTKTSISETLNSRIERKEPENDQTDGNNQAEVIPKVYSRVKKSKEEKSKEDLVARKLKFSSTSNPIYKRNEKSF